jgi:hypothetical protein
MYHYDPELQRLQREMGVVEIEKDGGFKAS